MFTRKFDRRVRVLVGVLAFSLVFGTSFGVYVLWGANQERGYQPEQPVFFPHSVMAGTHEMDCLYCHSNAEKGAHAGIPPVSLCMKCHQEILPKDHRGEVRATIAELFEYWPEPYEDRNGNGKHDPAEPYTDVNGNGRRDTDKKPIPWVKVHDLADFVYFDHSRHLTEEAGLECQDCHGEVETMDRVERVYSLKMGWCLDCHMEPPPEGAPEWQTTRAPIHCAACHR